VRADHRGWVGEGLGVNPNPNTVRVKYKNFIRKRKGKRNMPYGEAAAGAKPPSRDAARSCAHLKDHRNRRKQRGHGALCAIQHLGVVGEPGASGRGECVRGAINNRAPHRRPHSRHRRAQITNRAERLVW